MKPEFIASKPGARLVKPLDGMARITGAIVQFVAPFGHARLPQRMPCLSAVRINGDTTEILGRASFPQPRHQDALWFHGLTAATYEGIVYELEIEMVHHDVDASWRYWLDFVAEDGDGALPGMKVQNLRWVWRDQ